MPRSIFITATDTDAGKTWVTQSLLLRGLAANLDIQALKPIASGVNKHGVNEDVHRLASAQHVAPESINYITYQAAKAPALAANLEHQPLVKTDFLSWLDKQQAQKEITLIEGVGGLMVPLQADAQNTWLVSDWLATMHDVDVMLVAPLRLGCINHILLSCQQLKQIGKTPKWLILNDLAGTNTYAETSDLLSPFLRDIFGQTPEIIVVRQGEGMPDIGLEGLHSQHFS